MTDTDEHLGSKDGIYIYIWLMHTKTNVSRRREYRFVPSLQQAMASTSYSISK